MIAFRTVALLAGLGLSCPTWASNYPEVPRPIDSFDHASSLQGIPTLLDNLKTQGSFPLGKALFILGRVDLLGLSPSLDSFEVSTLETPLGGDFAVNEEQELQFRGSRATRSSVFDRPSRFATRRAEQRAQVRTLR